jgi:alkylation response protein AidB-like acyl-CoA dehydrogenase
MRFLDTIRALTTLLTLASWSPVAFAAHSPGPPHPGHLGITLFIARRTRVAASQQFDIAGRAAMDLDWP